MIVGLLLTMIGFSWAGDVDADDTKNERGNKSKSRGNVQRGRRHKSGERMTKKNKNSMRSRIRMRV